MMGLAREYSTKEYPFAFGRFVQFSDGAAARRMLSRKGRVMGIPWAILLYMENLSNTSNMCSLSYSDIMRDLSIQSKTTVMSAVKILREVGAITAGSSNRDRTTNYIVDKTLFWKSKRYDDVGKTNELCYLEDGERWTEVSGYVPFCQVNMSAEKYQKLLEVALSSGTAISLLMFLAIECNKRNLYEVGSIPEFADRVKKPATTVYDALNYLWEQDLISFAHPSPKSHGISLSHYYFWKDTKDKLPLSTFLPKCQIISMDSKNSDIRNVAL